jgi:hypothetical protein
MFHREKVVHALDFQNGMKRVVASSKYCEI